jgi:photosystem II stability/assembly factor-like uncharacterized protein
MKKLILLLIANILNSVVSAQTWTEQTASGSSPLNSVSAVSTQICWTGGNNGTVLRTVDGGLNWMDVGGGALGTNTVYAIAGIDSATALCSITPTTTTFIFRTSNGGVSWSPVFAQSPGFIHDIKMYSLTEGYAYGNPVIGRWSLWRTTNAGANWDSAGLMLISAGGEAGSGNGMYIEGANRIWFCTNNTRIYFTTNAGTNWFFGITTGAPSTICVAFNGNTGFCGTSISSALVTTDGGFNWTPAALPGAGLIRSISNVGNRFWYVRGSEIYYSSNNGATFSFQYNAASGTYNHMSFVFSPLNNLSTLIGWSVRSNHGISRYYENISSIHDPGGSKPEVYKLYQNYPNPFNSSSKFKVQSSKLSRIKIVIYNVLGKEIATLVNGNLGPGVYEVGWDASEYPSGIYFYQVMMMNRRSEVEYKETRTMVLIK